MKVCSKCKVEKPFSEYHKRSSSKLGVRSQCKNCEYEYEIKKRKEKNKIKLAVKERERVSGMRICKTCKKEKPFSEYAKQPKKSLVTGEILYYYQCIKCISARIQKWREENYDERFAYRKKHREKNKDKLKEKSKKYYEENQDKIKLYRDENKEKIKKQRQEHRKKNRKKLNDRFKKWSEEGGRLIINKRRIERSKNDPLYKLKIVIRSRLNIAINRGGYTKRSKTIKYLGADWIVVKEYIEKNFKKGMNWKNHGEWHIDHIVPLASANNEEEIFKLSHYTNLQPIWAEENIIKSAKYKEEDKKKFLEWYDKNV